MLRFKDMFPMGIEYRPGEDELVNYRALRRKRTIGVGEGGPIGESTEVDEALSVQSRLKKGRDMRRNKAKIALGRSRAARRFASNDTLKKRARRSAYQATYKRLIKNISKDDLTPQRKAEIEKRLNSPAFKTRIDRMSKKMIKDVRKKEMERKRAK